MKNTKKYTLCKYVFGLSMLTTMLVYFSEAEAMNGPSKQPGGGVSNVKLGPSQLPGKIKSVAHSGLTVPPGKIKSIAHTGLTMPPGKIKSIAHSGSYRATWEDKKYCS
jgi:hypothetical protein